MAEVHDILLDAEKVVNDTLRRLVFDAEVTLLKVSATTNLFEEVETIANSWFFEYSRFRQNFLLEIARDDQTLTDAMAEATHVRIDDDVYVIREADTLPPKGMDVSWKIFCDRFVERSQFGAIY